jgi:hypothetical protein
VLSANGAAGPDEVAFAPGLAGTITLTSGAITITDSLIVAGPGAGVLTVTSAIPRRQIFHVDSVAATPIDATLSGLTLTGGSGEAGEGGAVVAYNENLTILDSVISDSIAAGCGGNVALIRYTGSPLVTLRIVNSTLTGGTAGVGGNICVFGGRLILERSTVSGGSAYHGGGLSLDEPADGNAILFSTIFGNEAESRGGGIYVEESAGNMLIESSTISGNSAGDEGGGVGLFFSSGSSFLRLRLTTLSNNSAHFGGGNIQFSSSSEVHLDHSIAANGTPHDLPGHVLPFTVAADYSLIEAPGVTIPLGANNLIGVDPLLGPLTNNGGPTLTHSPLPGSPVIDSGDPAIPDPPPTDQRGFARIVGPAIDRGSVEAQQQIGITEVPTLSQWAMLFLSALLFAAGVRRMRNQGSSRNN